MRDTLRDTLIFCGALRLLREDGWRRGDIGSRGRPHCLAGAIAEVKLGDPLKAWVNEGWGFRCDADVEWLWWAAAVVAARLFPGRTRFPVLPANPYTALYWFNDDPHTTQEDVELVLKHLIENPGEPTGG